MSDKSITINTEKCLKLKVKELQGKCKSRGLPIYGTKKTLCDRLKRGKISKKKVVRSVTKPKSNIVKSMSFNTEKCLKLKVKELQGKCKSRGLPIYGTKKKLCDRLKHGKVLRKKSVWSALPNSNLVTTKRFKNKVKKNIKTFKKSYDILQFQDSFPELGIKRGDWFNDPCYLLKNIKKRINGEWTTSNVMKLAVTLPNVNINSKPSTGTVFRYGSDYIKIGGKLGNGSYGVVYAGKRGYKIDGKINYNKNIAIKVLQTPDVEEFVNETLIHNELFCGMRGNWGTGGRIPKIEFMASYDINGQKQFLVGMEPLDGEGFNTFRTSSKRFAKQIKSIATLLSKLQKKFKFMHRDLHTNNIMYKGDKMYIIDFGRSTIKVGNQWINKDRMEWLFKKTKIFNPSQDLRTLSMFLLEIQMERVNGKHLIGNNLVLWYLLKSTGELPSYVNNWRERPFWTTHPMINVIDDNFTPENIIKLMNRIINGNSRDNYKDAYSLMVDHNVDYISLQNHNGQLAEGLYVHKASNFAYKKKMAAYLRRIYREVFGLD